MALTLQIICNPYTKRITYRGVSGEVSEDLDRDNALLQYDEKEFSYIVTDIVEEVYGQDYECIIFEGSDDDYEELEYAVKTVPLLKERFKGRKELECIRSEKRIINACDALSVIEDEFETLQDIIEKKYTKQSDIKREIKKYSETVSEEIPIVIMGTYSSGKSAFINALIGAEVLPSATTTTTAKTHRIKKSTSAKVGKISFKYDGEKVVISFKNNEVDIVTNCESEFCNNLYTSITENSKDNTIESHIYQALKQLNEQDIKDSRNEKKSHFSDLIEVEIPSEKGIFSEKKFNYSILDTPGSDSADEGSGRSHFEILKQALENQTNGLPIFVTVPERMNSAGNKELLNELKGINLDIKNMIIIVNKAEEASNRGIEKLKAETDVIREWQSTRIYFVSSIAGLAGQKRTEKFYNDEYERPLKKNKEDFTDKNNPDYLQLYEYNIMPNSQKERIRKKCHELIESGDENSILYANSGIQCVVEEIFNYGEKHALYNKCTNAKNYLVNAISVVCNEIEEKNNEIQAPAEEITKKLDEKKKKLIERLRSISDDFSKKVISNYPNVLSSKKDEKLNDKKSKIGQEWIKYYKSLFENEQDKMGGSFLPSLKRIPKTSFTIIEEYKQARDIIDTKKYTPKNKIEGMILKSVNSSKKGIEAVVKTTINMVDETKDVFDEHYDEKKIIRSKIKNSVERSLLEDIRDIDGALYYESRKYFKKQERELKDQLIASATDKDVDELSEEEKEKIKDVIEKFPELEENGKEASLLQDSQIAHYLFGKFIDLGDINYKKMADASKKALDDMVSEQILIIQSGFEKSFKTWRSKLISNIEGEITSLNPELLDWSKEKCRLETELTELEQIKDTIVKSQKNLDKLLTLEGDKNG